VRRDGPGWRVDAPGGDRAGGLESGGSPRRAGRGARRYTFEVPTGGAGDEVSVVAVPVAADGGVAAAWPGDGAGDAGRRGLAEPVADGAGEPVPTHLRVTYPTPSRTSPPTTRALPGGRRLSGTPCASAGPIPRGASGCRARRRRRLASTSRPPFAPFQLTWARQDHGVARAAQPQAHLRQ
jgi:hypothetical protein